MRDDSVFKSSQDDRERHAAANPASSSALTRNLIVVPDDVAEMRQAYQLSRTLDSLLPPILSVVMANCAHASLEPIDTLN